MKNTKKETSTQENLRLSFLKAVVEAGGNVFRIKAYPVSDSVKIPGKATLPSIMAYSKEARSILSAKRLDWEKDGYVTIDGVDIPIINEEGYTVGATFLNEEDCDATIIRLNEASFETAKGWLEEASNIAAFLESVVVNRLM